MGLVNDLIVRIRGDKSQLDSTLEGAKSSLNSFGSIVKKIGGIIGVAFGVHAIVEFTKEAMKAAAEAEGIANAFKKIGDKSLLSGLKEATRGVVGNTDLMRMAVKASNFNIPLQDLAKYLDFATKRAIQTGKSVGELTDLIVTGLGRKSSRSFIELGLAAKTVQEAFKTPGGMLKLITEQTEKMGDVADTTAEKYQQLAVSFGELKKAWGNWVNNSPAMNSIVQWAKDMLEIMKDPRLTVWQKINGTPDQYKELKKKRDEATNDLVGNVNKMFPGQVDFLKDLNEKVDAQKTIADKVGEELKAEEEITKELEKQKELNSHDSAGYKLRPIAGRERGPTGLTGFTPLNPKDVPLANVKPAEINVDKQAVAYQTLDDRIQEVTLDTYNLQSATGDLSNVFMDMFDNTGKGFDMMVNDMIKSLERLVAEIIAKKVIMLLVQILGNKVLPGLGSSVSGAIGGMNMGNTVGGVSSVGGGSLTLDNTIKIQGTLKGQDIFLSGSRYGQSLSNNT
jgi:hypothetical protein